jgi:hypothetical protein
MTGTQSKVFYGWWVALTAALGLFLNTATLCGVPPTEQRPDFQLLSTEANPARPDTKVILIRHATSHTQLCSNT